MKTLLRALLLVGLSSILLVGCAGPGEQEEVTPTIGAAQETPAVEPVQPTDTAALASPTAESVQPTDTAAPAAPLPTDTAVPPATETPVPLPPPPTVPPAPSAQPSVGTATVTPMALAPLPTEPIRIEFEPGATSAVRLGRIDRRTAGGIEYGRRYVLRALAGQTMDVTIDAPNRDVLLEIVGADGIPLQRYADNKASWRGVLPATQDYFVDPVSVGGTTNFALIVTISPLEPERARIQFATGATSATIAGSIRVGASGGVVFGSGYVLRALAGQTMEVTVVSPRSDVLLQIVGEDGVPLKRYADGQAWWRGTLPATQDYLIDPVATRGDSDFTLTVSISALRPQRSRIEFAPGATSATVNGTIRRQAAEGVEFGPSYVLRALAGQTMKVTITSPRSDVLLQIVGEDGVPLKRYEVGEPWFSGVLPATQDYLIDAVSVGGNTDFTLVVAISALSGPVTPTRIQFAAGATSATVQGNLGSGEAVRFVLRAMVGQRMEIQAWPATLAINVQGQNSGFWGVSSGVGQLTIPSLPLTQDYTITLSVLGAGAPTSYAMDVRIP